MIELFRKSDGRGPDTAPGSALASHILAKFLKRLRAMEKPRLLDLGRVSGANIEFFARARCRVQVEDLVQSLPETPPRDPVPFVAASTDAGPGPVRRAGTNGTDVAAPPAAGAAPARPGARPTRRIVLPPRAIAAAAPLRTTGLHAATPLSARPGGTALAGAARRSWLPTRFSYDDEAFDAVVAWDVFNYYDPLSVRDVAAEARRVLKPGGLLFCYFHARRLEGADSPRRYRILDDQHVACDEGPGVALARHVYQNREIEKMFAGLTIIELYFLKNSMREILMEKKAVQATEAKPLVRPAEPRTPRFTIE
jgi:SAM-dependent methyltransferase